MMLLHGDCLAEMHQVPAGSVDLWPTYILATPTALAASPEVAKLIREAEAHGWREAAKEARECDYPWASPTNEQADACDQMAERIADWLDRKAEAAAIRKDEEN